MLKRYQVRWKQDGQYSNMLLGNDTFFTFRGAKRRQAYLNHIGREMRSQTVAIVWDRDKNEQMSTGLYED